MARSAMSDVPNCTASSASLACTSELAQKIWTSISPLVRFATPSLKCTR